MRTLSLLLLTFATLYGNAVAAATLPALPQSFIDTTYAPPTGNTITVNAGGNLQTAINNAALGDTIVLQAGVSFTGPFTLPNKSGTGWIYIRSSAYASLPPPGTRVTPADAVNMPKLQVPVALGGAIQTSNGAHNYRFVGIEIRPITASFVFNLVDIGAGVSSLANLPRDITFDRCYIHGDPTVGGRRGVSMNGIRVAVIDSHVSDFKEVGADSQALLVTNSPGPLKIFNNYLEGAAENFMSGGGDPAITNLVPSDIEIRRNHFFKPLAWINEPWTVKNLLELKNAQRVLIEGNLFENNWKSSDQNGFVLVVTPRNQGGSAPWSVTQDVTIRLNRFVNTAQGILVVGTDDSNPSQLTRRVLVEHNTIQVTGLQGGLNRLFQITRGPTDLTIRHNTGLIAASPSDGASAFSSNSPRSDQLDFRDNLLSRGIDGFGGQGSGGGTSSLNAHYTNHTFVGNAIIGPTGGTYPGGNFFPANNTAVAFQNVAAGDYRLMPSSPFKGAATDGTDVGANVGMISAAIAGYPATADADNDGVPNAVEYNEGLNVAVKDNDIFTSARLFAMQQYRDFLGREGDAGGINFYTQQINGGRTRAEVVEDFTNSPEFLSGLPQCTRLYFSFFNRIPDYDGLLFQVGQFRNNVPLDVIAQNFANSPEFTNTYGSLTNDQYVNLVYQNVLGRAPDPDGYNFYFNHLQNGTMTRGQVMIGFSESPEFSNNVANEVFTVAVYVGILRRSPDPGGLDFYVDILDAGGTRNSVITGFINSPEYRNRFLP